MQYDTKLKYSNYNYTKSIRFTQTTQQIFAEYSMGIRYRYPIKILICKFWIVNDKLIGTNAKLKQHCEVTIVCMHCNVVLGKYTRSYFPTYMQKVIN